MCKIGRTDDGSDYNQRFGSLCKSWYKNLLLIKDSYAHSLVPFLANHYSKITMVDMRYINVDLGRLIDLSEYQQTMFMYNAVTFSSDLTIKRISLTK